MATADATRMSENRARARDLVISPVFDAKRRAACEADDCEWLRTYLPGVFYNPFTPYQKRVIEDCGTVMRYGTKKCTAAPRGDGKSSIVKYLSLKYALSRQLRFPLIIGATSSKAGDMLSDIKHHLALRSITPLSQDYPVETAVARYVGPWPSRAKNVTANGRRPINVEWGADTIILPTWEDEEPMGPIVRSLGITSDDLQGCNVYDVRPDFVMLDDLDSRDSLSSAEGVIAGKIEDAIDKTVAGMAGQSKSLGIYMLCTITSRRSAAFKYSDTSQKPAYCGERIAAILKWPERTDLWQSYIELREWGTKTLDDNKRAVDPFARKAYQFYIDNRDAMDGGAELSNPFNFKASVLPDGSQQQISGLQRCYDYIADHGMPSFMTEHQNDPPEDTGVVESGINAEMIRRQVSGFAQGVVPPDCVVLAHGVDVGKYKLHWVVRAFRADGTGFTVDYGQHDVYNTKYGSDEGLDRAIRREVVRRVSEFRDMPYAKQFRDSLTLVDSGYRTEAVYAACEDLGMGVMPIKGIGYSAGVAQQGRFVDEMKHTKLKEPVCDGVFLSTQYLPPLNPFQLVCADADQWKAWEHDRWMTAQDKPGCLFLFGEKGEDVEFMSADQRAHGHYAHHICAEVEVEEIVKGAMKRRWKAKGENHWLDASYYADVAAAIKGIRALGQVATATPPSRPAIVSTGHSRQSRW